MRVLVACEFSGIVRDAFAARGHDAWSCDILPSERPNGKHLQGDVLLFLDGNWDLMIAHPPCTYLAVTGNRWFNEKYSDRFPDRAGQRSRAIKFFMDLANAPIERVCIENPVGVMSSIWRKPDQIIQPYLFGHREPKKTCLWLKNLPQLVSTDVVEPEYHVTKSGKRVPAWFFNPSPSPERKRMRERTFPGIAQAMAEQWG